GRVEGCPGEPPGRGAGGGEALRLHRDAQEVAVGALLEAPGEVDVGAPRTGVVRHFCCSHGGVVVSMLAARPPRIFSTRPLSWLLSCYCCHGPLRVSGGLRSLFDVGLSCAGAGRTGRSCAGVPPGSG